MLFKAIKTVLHKVITFGTVGKPNSADNRITVLSNVMVFFGAFALLAIHSELVKQGITGKFLWIYFIISGLCSSVLVLTYFGHKTLARVLVTIVLNATAWNALVFYGKTFNGYYTFFCAFVYCIVAFDEKHAWIRWITLSVSFLGLPLADYLSHNNMVPITGLNSADFPLFVLVFDSIVVSLILITIVYLEKVLGEQNERDLRNLNNNLESIVEERTQLLRVAKEEAQAASQAKSQFVANTSHELRTPLGAIIGFVDIILDLKPTEKEKTEYLQIIRKNAHQLSLIVDEVLDLSKIEAQKLTLKMEYFSLKNFLYDLQNLMALKAEEKNLQFHIQPLNDLPNTIYSDPLRLKQVLVNLIGNAIKFTEKGKILIQVSCVPRVDNLFQIQFDIEDTGVGIIEKDIDKVFKPFSQSDAGLMRKFGGTGLGLSLSKQLTKMLGGELTLVRTKVNVGSLFRLTLECRGLQQIATATSVPSFPEKQPEAKIENLAGKRILIVDDLLDNVRLIRCFLEEEGAQLEFAGNGQEALDRIRLEGDRFSAVLMDLQMPVMDGYEATRRLRDEGHNLPVIAITASAMKEDRDKAIAEGFTDYLTKPLQRSLLVSTLKKWVR